MRIHSIIGLLALGVSFAAPVSAQLDLPERPRASGEEAPRSRGAGRVHGLDLPESLEPTRAETLGLAPPTAEPGPGGSEPNLAGADQILLELRRIGSITREREIEFADRLLAVGEPGLAAARGALMSTSVMVRVTVQRVLLMGGVDEDRALVVESLKSRVPGRSASQLLNGLHELDPVLASPELFLDLLAHPQASMRSAAAALLAPDLDDSRVGDLSELMKSGQADTRLHALQLASGLDSSSAVELLFEALGDSDARVASHAALSLARVSGESVDARLLEVVSSASVFSRYEAYALIAIIEREDMQTRAILDAGMTDVLLRNLAEGLEVSVGASACALAGLGFRSDRSTPSQWLELLVPHHLVRIVGGTEFHPDLTALEGTARRRLALISGRDLGGDGRAWASWWADSAKDFRAHRAIFPVSVSDAESIRVTYRSQADDVRLSVYGDPAGGSTSPEQGAIWLAKNQCIDLYRVLEKEGLFSAQRVSSVRAIGARPDRELSLATGGYEKVFIVGPSGAEPWFERVVEVLRALEERNRWQRYFPEVRRNEEPAAWVDERQFWSESHDAHERARRLKRLVLSNLNSLNEEEFETGLGELERLFAQPRVADASDFQALTQRLNREDFYSPVVPRMVGLALRAARAERGEQPAPEAVPELVALDGARAMDEELALSLSDLLSDKYGSTAIEDLRGVFLASPSAWARTHVTSPRPVLRAAAIRALALDLSPGVDRLFERSLKDPEFEVEAAAVRALGERSALLLDRPGTEGQRKTWADSIYARLDSPTGKIQLAAIHAMAQSRDERAIGAMLPALSSTKAGVRRAASEGLASLKDRATAPILVSLLARGPRAIVFESARQGLVDLGADGHDELLRIVNRREPGLSRESALILAEGGVAAVASSLLAILTENPGDERVATELAILTAVDFRGEADPAQAWWDWWDTVRQDSSEAWLFAAAERLGLRSPEEGALTGSGTRSGAELLLALLQAQEEFLVTRAERELSRMTGERLEAPMAQAERDELLLRNWPK